MYLLQKLLDKGIGHLMIDTAQALICLMLKDKCAAPHHPGAFYIDYMMKIRALLFNKTFIGFHMFIGKGDYVLVGGLSYHGSDDKPATDKYEEGG